MIFKRYEIKFLLTRRQKAALMDVMGVWMVPDVFGKTTIQNLYLHTNDFRLIRASIEKPVYKEKLRIRSYRPPKADDDVFVELKKKYCSVVYKRRLALPWSQVRTCFDQDLPLPEDSQIAREINYFREFYGSLVPAVFLSYDREAYYGASDKDLRITFDENILCRRREFVLDGAIYGQPLLADDHVLMEIKCSGGIPLWMPRFLSEHHIYKTSFSKYGTAYARMIFAAMYMYRTRYTKSFVVTLALLPAVVCVVIMMVNGNVGTGVAVAGAFSLVRFRSVPGTAREIGILFLAMGAGLITGMGYLGYGFLFTIILSLVNMLYSHLDFGMTKNSGRFKTLHITIPENLDYTGVFDEIFREYTDVCTLVQVRTVNMGSLFKLTYDLTLKKTDCEKEMMDKLRYCNGNLEISISRQETSVYEL